MCSSGVCVVVVCVVVVCVVVVFNSYFMSWWRGQELFSIIFRYLWLLCTFHFLQYPTFCFRGVFSMLCTVYRHEKLP